MLFRPYALPREIFGLSEVNPYRAPDAALNVHQDAAYQPRIFSFSGRIGRLRSLAYGLGIGTLFMLVMGILGGLAEPYAVLRRDEGLTLLIGFTIILVWAVLTLMYGKRRFNDLNRSGWWSILLLVPYVQLLPAIYLLFFPGSPGANEYGPAPVKNSTGVAIIGWTLPLIMIVSLLAAILIPAYPDYIGAGAVNAAGVRQIPAEPRCKKALVSVFVPPGRAPCWRNR